jgi:hypothetical protein
MECERDFDHPRGGAGGGDEEEEQNVNNVRNKGEHTIQLFFFPNMMGFVLL